MRAYIPSRPLRRKLFTRKVATNYVMVYHYPYRVGDDEDWKCYRWYEAHSFSLDEQAVRMSDREARSWAQDNISTMNSRRGSHIEMYLLYRIFRVGKNSRIIKKIYQEGRSVRLREGDVLGTHGMEKYLR